MPSTRPFDLRSAALGGMAALGLLALVALAPPVQNQGIDATFGTVRVVGSIHVKGIPEATDMVRIVEGMPYTVPQGRILVIRGVAAAGPAGGNINKVYVLFDGLEVFVGSASEGTLGELPMGLTAPAGTEITAYDNISSQSALSVVLAYLEDE